MLRITLIITGLLIILPSMVVASSARDAVSLDKKWGIGINYPGLGLKYKINSKNTVEIRTQLEKDIFIIGSRYYYNFSLKDKLVLFCGGEADHLRFKGRVSEGAGIAILAFIGGEYLTTPDFGVSLDIGPACLSLKDRDTGEMEKGIDFVLNLGLTYYFGGNK
ncbi:hypothetical protein KKE26_11065 [bacterium]|nr:hypothetical protein [bacterium]MBU1754602.1 hypothetical protein [bacterium]